MRKLERLQTIIIVIIMIITFSFNSISNANNANKHNISVSKSNGREYRTIANLHLRQGNSTSFNSITVMPKRSLVKHLGTTKNNWFKLEYNGKIGYALRRYVTSKSNYNKNYSDIEVSKSNGKRYITTANLHLREGNSTNFDSIIVMKKGSLIKHIGTTNNGWYKVDYNGKTGYIHSDYVKTSDSKAIPNGSIVFLDYGHGGKDTGAIGPKGRLEKNETLRVGLLVAKELRKNGVIVDESRTGDIVGELDLNRRTVIANKKNYDYFVSIHRNIYDRQAYGVETFSHKDSSRKSKQLASVVQKNLVGVGFNDRKAKHKDLYVLRKTKSPAILIEIGFIDSSTDNWIFDKKLNDIAKAISNGILSELARNK